MRANAAENHSAQTLPSYALGCYAVPIRFLYGTAAQINFWDVIYFCAHQGGGAFDTSTEELAKQTGISRQIVSQLRQEAIAQGDLIEDTSLFSGRRFVLHVTGFERLTQNVIWKPLGYVRNGWHHVITPAIPKRVLNLYLQQPRQRIYRLDGTVIADRCKRQFPYGGYRPVAPLNLSDVSMALRLLVRLGVLLPEEDGMRIDWETFNQPAPAAAPLFDAPDPREHPAFCRAAAVDPERAARALELFDVGYYSIEEIEPHYTDMFRDLAYVRDDDYALLKAKVHRYRNRPPGPKRWRTMWKAFQYELRRRVAEVRAPKSILYLDEATGAACNLAVDLGQSRAQILALRMVSRVEWPWHYEQAALALTLRAGERALFTRTVSPGDAEVRYAFHPNDWLNPLPPLVLRAQSDSPLSGVRVEAWLEARLRR